MPKSLLVLKQQTALIAFKGPRTLKAEIRRLREEAEAKGVEFTASINKALAEWAADFDKELREHGKPETRFPNHAANGAA